MWHQVSVLVAYSCVLQSILSESSTLKQQATIPQALRCKLLTPTSSLSSQQPPFTIIPYPYLQPNGRKSRVNYIRNKPTSANVNPRARLSEYKFKLPLYLCLPMNTKIIIKIPLSMLAQPSKEDNKPFQTKPKCQLSEEGSTTPQNINSTTDTLQKEGSTSPKNQNGATNSNDTTKNNKDLKTPVTDSTSDSTTFSKKKATRSDTSKKNVTVPTNEITGNTNEPTKDNNDAQDNNNDSTKITTDSKTSVTDSNKDSPKSIKKDTIKVDNAATTDDSHNKISKAAQDKNGVKMDTEQSDDKIEAKEDSVTTGESPQKTEKQKLNAATKAAAAASVASTSDSSAAAFAAAVVSDKKITDSKKATNGDNSNKDTTKSTNENSTIPVKGFTKDTIRKESSTSPKDKDNAIFVNNDESSKKTTDINTSGTDLNKKSTNKDTPQANSAPTTDAIQKENLTAAQDNNGGKANTAQSNDSMDTKKEHCIADESSKSKIEKQQPAAAAAATGTDQVIDDDTIAASLVEAASTKKVTGSETPTTDSNIATTNTDTKDE